MHSDQRQQVRCVLTALVGLLLASLGAVASASAFGPSIRGPEWSDAAGWDLPENYATILALDYNGDGRDDLCTHPTVGVTCSASLGDAFAALSLFNRLLGLDQTGPQYRQTARVIQAASRDYYCIRSATLFGCLIGIGPAFGLFDLRDNDGWDSPEYYDTIRTLNLNGDGIADLCARAPSGVICFLKPEGEQLPFEPGFSGPVWSDADAWNQPQYYRTIRALDFNGDGRGDLCARSAQGMHCYASTGDGFESLVLGPQWSDANAWVSPQYYETIRALDYNGDGLDDLCARASAGIVCQPSLGDGFGPAINGPAWSDAAGWNSPEYYQTIRVMDYNGDGRDDLCARSPQGFICHPSSGQGFGAEVTGPAWSDANGWAAPQYYETITTLDYNGDGFDDVCARDALGIGCSPSDERFLMDGFEP